LIAAQLTQDLAMWNTDLLTYQLTDLSFPQELNDAVDTTTNKANQISNENINLNLKIKEMEGEVQKANTENGSIINEGTATINKLVANNEQNIGVDTEKLTQTKLYLDDFMTSLDVSNAADIITTMFKLLYLEGYYSNATEQNIAILKQAKLYQCVETENGLCSWTIKIDLIDRYRIEENKNGTYGKII